MFTWVIWGVTTVIIFFAQFSDGGGAGTWSVGVSGLITLGIAILAYQKKSDITITKMDWIFFLLALTAVPIWVLTSNPVWAVVILTTIDTVAFLPTIRKSYSHPHQENLEMYAIMVVRNAIAIVALEHYSITTLLFLIVTAVTSIFFIPMVLIRRRK